MKKFSLSSLFVAMSLALSVPAIAQEEKAEDAQEQEKEKSFEEKLAEKVAMSGLLDIYRDSEDGSGYVVITDDMLDKHFLYTASTVNGVIDAGTFKGAYRDGKIIKFRKYFDRIDILAVNPRFYFDEDSAISKASDANISDAVLVSAKIQMHEDGKYAIDMKDVFLNESIHKVSPFPRPGSDKDRKRYKLGKFEDGKSRIVEINNFPENTHVTVDYVFVDSNPKNRGSNELADPRYVSVQLQHAIVELPENDFIPRRDDPRIGYFTQQFDDLTSDETANFRDVINRWHLEKKDPEAAVSDPVEPITWWIENTTPHEWRDTIRDATLAWNQAFEKAGISNAIEVKVQPDDAQWSADDVRYNVMRWTSSPRPPFGGYGPSVANPYTGQIIAADIMLEYTFMKGRWILGSFLSEGFSETELANIEQEDLHCSLGHAMNGNLLFGQAAALANGMGDVEKEKMLKQTMYYLILHEVGHTLGLNHNMRATQMHSNDVVHDQSVTQGILAGSVMDYPSVNFAPPGKEQGDFYTDRPGPYDDWVIEYGYSQALSDEAAEEARLEAILSRSTQPDLAFGNDADDMRAPGRHIDPRVNIFDMSGDAIEYAKDRFALIRDTFSKMPEKALAKGETYNDLVVGVNAVFTEFSRQANVTSRYIGGVYVERDFVGQEGAKQPYTPTPEATQKAALASLADNIFSPDAYDSMGDLYALMQKQRRSFNGFGKNEDPKVHDMVLKAQTGVLTHIMHPNVTKRIVDTALYGNTYTLEEMMSDLTDAIFAADMKSNVNSFRRNLQVAYVDRLIGMSGLEGSSKHDAFSQAVAVFELAQLRDELSSRRGDQATKVHRSFLLNKINSVFHKSDA
ncbi:MAG: zinc-dependent metalloprotease [Aestuariibacter sp.]